MKRFALSVLATGVMLGAAIASQAQTLTYELLTDTTWTTAGVGGTAIAGRSGFDSGIINQLFAPSPNPFTYNTALPGSVVSFGADVTIPGTGNPNTYTNFAATPVDFHFTLTGPGGGVDTFHASGLIDGTVGIGSTGAPFSAAKIVFTSITDSFGNVSVAGSEPATGNPALKITSVIDGVTVETYLDTPQSKPAPNANALSVSGFIRSPNAVPEPGTVALLASSCITGSVFLLRRFRRG